MGSCNSTSNCNPCGPDFNAINQLATQTAAYARQANTYAVDAQNAWLEFNALYLGAFSVAPTVDNEGNPLQVGALYWNSVSSQLFVWNGTIWVLADFNQFTPFLATGTTFARNLVTREADVVNVLDFGADPTGSNPSTTAITNAIAAGINIILPEGTYLIDSNITVSSGKTITFAPGASVTSIAVNTLDFDNNAILIAERTKIFFGAASATNIKTAYPEWWGATHSTTTTSNAAFQSALDALKQHGTLSLNNGFYAINGTTALSVSKGQIIQGAGGNNTSFVITTPATNLFEVTAVRNASFRGFKIFGAATITPTSGTAIFYNQTSGTSIGNIALDDLRIERVFNAMHFRGNSGQTLNTGAISNITIRTVFNFCVLYNWCENIYSYNININADTGGGTGSPAGGFLLFNKCQTVDFLACHVSNSAGGGLVVTNSAGVISPGNDVRWCQFSECYFDDCENGADLNNCSNLRFTSCWFCSCGRSFRGYAGNGLWIRPNTEAITFVNGIFSNNGQRGIRIDTGSKAISILNSQIAGNSINDTSISPFWAIEVYDNVSDFLISNNIISGTDFGWSSGNSKGVQIRPGTSNNYIVTNNLISNTFGVGNEFNDAGTGLNKIVSGNITW